jgi:hypothetical protein
VLEDMSDAIGVCGDCAKAYKEDVLVISARKMVMHSPGCLVEIVFHHDVK